MRGFILLTLLPALLAQVTTHLSNLRQLTFGGQNAEAYWSPDGKRLVFQSTREPFQCDQIFVMNADGSGQRLISTGKGRTTCGYFLPDNKHILYASTHEDGEACPAPPDRSKGYVWAVYPSFDIYLATDTGKIVKKLTTAPGYDAEATVHFRTKQVVYTSMASGDLDLWLMNPDGSGKRRISSGAGYDGGAVFSPDGQKLVWRANYPSTPDAMAKYKELLGNHLTSPMKMEIIVADASGHNAKQITNFECASFAPAFTPDSQRIVFASNKHACGSNSFELYMMKLDGSELERVTTFNGFTSFPEFSPDGKRIVFASNYQGKSRYEFNIFTADWR
jgi:Tol biopolymer transport system component